MTTDMNTCHIAKSGNIITPKGRLSYAHFLIEPQERVYEDTKKTVKIYTMNLLVPKGANLTELKKSMGKIALEKCDGDQKRAKNFVEQRFIDPNNLPKGGKPYGEEFEGWTLIRATSQYKPKFAYPNGKEIPDEEIEKELYSGRFGRATLNAYWSNHQANKGVCLGLQNIQLLDHAEPMGTVRAGVEDDFGGEDSSSFDTNVDDMFN